MIQIAAEIVFGLLMGSGLGAILLALGERVRSLLRLPAPSGLKPATAFALGSLVLGLATLGAGLVHGFRPGALLGVTVLAAVMGDWRSVPKLVRPLFVPFAIALPLWPVALAPPFFYDSWVYHLGLPWQALKDGALLPHPENLFSTFPPLAQLIYAIPLSAGAMRATGWIHLIGYLTAAAAVTSVARRLGASRSVALLAGAAVLYLPTAALVPAFPASEAWAVSAIVAAVGLALAVRPIRASAIAAGLLAGVALAARLQGAPWTAPVALILIARSMRPKARESISLSVRTLAMFALCVTVGSAPWWTKNTVLLGDPMAPIGWHRAGVDTLWRDAMSNMNLAKGTADLVARVAGALRAKETLVLPLLVAGLFAYWRERRALTLLVVGAGTLGWIVWSLTGALDRFLTPTLALLVAAASAIGRRGAGRALSAAIVLTVLALGAWKSFALDSALGGLSVVGAAPAVYASTLISDPSPAYRACEALPSDARLLLVSEPRGFLLPRRFETGSQVDVPELAGLLERDATAEDTAKELRRLGFTHLLVNVSEMHRLGASYPVLPWSSAKGQGRFVQLMQLFGKPVILEGGVAVYALAGTQP